MSFSDMLFISGRCCSLESAQEIGGSMYLCIPLEFRLDDSPSQILAFRWQWPNTKNKSTILMSGRTPRRMTRVSLTRKCIRMKESRQLKRRPIESLLSTHRRKPWESGLRSSGGHKECRCHFIRVTRAQVNVQNGGSVHEQPLW
jgi:hypothetical protein